jgi:hypothetical protein
MLVTMSHLQDTIRDYVRPAELPKAHQLPDLTDEEG